MLTGILHTVFKPRVVAGVLPRADGTFDLIVLRKKGAKVLVENTRSQIGEDELYDSLDKGRIPIVLCITGADVLVKTIPPLTSDRKLLQEVLPGAKASDFWLTTADMVGGNTLASLVRLQVTTDILERIQNLKVSVIGLEAGPSVLEIMARGNLLRSNSELNTAGFHVEFSKEGSLYKVDSTSANDHGELEIGGEQVPLKLLIPAAAALKHLMLTPTSDDLPEKYSHQWHESLYKRAYTSIMKYSLTAVFMLLLINFGVYTYFFSENTRMDNQYSGIKVKLQKLDKLSSEYDLIYGFLSERGWLAPSRVSFYADRLSAEIPESIRLKHMAIFPQVEEKNKLSIDLPTYDPNGIVVEGEVNTNLVLNSWVDVLRSYNWIESLSLEEYKHGKGSEPAQFKLNIQIKT